MLPSESDSHKVGKKVSTSVQAYVSSSYYLVLPPPRKRHPCISYWKKFVWSKLCALIQLKSQPQCSGVANIPSITIPSEHTQNILYFLRILLRLRPMLALILEEGVCGRSTLSVPLQLSTSCSSHTLHSEEIRKDILLGNKCNFTYKRHLQENVTFSLRSPSDS